MKKQVAISFLLWIIFACTQKQAQIRPNAFSPKISEATGYIVPKNRISEPQVVTARNPTAVQVGKQKVILTNPNKRPSGIPKIVLAGIPSVITPGQDNFFLPNKVSAIDSPFAAGNFEVVIAKSAAAKDQNSQNFSSFNKLQGLRSSYINCLLEDKKGNLWFGMDGQGVSKYDGKYFTHLTVKEGLSGNSVYSILQDKSGNMWFGTSGGVSKYDGKYFTRFTEKEGLSNNVVECILQDKSGNMWFGTSGGVSKFDGKSFVHFTVSEGLSNNSVYSILQDTVGNLWFGTYGGGVSKYDGKSFFHLTEKEGLPSNFVSSILQDKSGNLWFGTFDRGVSKYDGKSFTYFTDKEGLSNNVIVCILQDKSKNLWFSTFGGGVSKYDGKSFVNFTEKEGLPSNSVYSILQDRSGNLWFGTFGGGLSRYNGRSFTHFTEKEGLANNVVISILQDKCGNLWFGNFGGGISKYDGKSFTHFTQNEGVPNNIIRSILQDRSGNLWFGTSGWGVSKYDGKSFKHFTKSEGLPSNSVSSILQDKSGNLWFGTFGGGVSKYDGKSFTYFTDKEGLSNNNVSCILQDTGGNLWFGTYGGGVSKFDGKSFVHFTVNEGLSNNNVSSILQDKSGNLWIGTLGGGVSRYDGRAFTAFTEKQGLSDNFVESILQDKSGNLWFATRFGLDKLSREKLAEISDIDKLTSLREEDILFINFNFEEGFPGVGCHVLCEDNNGTIWIGTDDRLTAYHPEGDKRDTTAPNVQITGVDLFNEIIPWANLEGKNDTNIILSNGLRVANFEFDSISKWNNIPEHLSLPYNINYLTFNYIGITTNSPRKVRYRYKLEGFDENWSALTSRTEAPYSHLAPGNYSFEVRAMNGEGYWSNEINYNFTIRPPWWKTWWAYCFYFFSIAGCIWYYIRWRERALIARQKALEKTVEERTSDVVAEKKKVEVQHARSEELLLNILPSEVAEELKQKGRAEARQFDEVTVMFTDFKGFTQISEKLTPAELVAEIHDCFKSFDEIITRYNIEKIKTIGDSYMCAGGLPVANKTSAIDVISAAMEIQQFMKEHLQERMKEGKESFEIRIGIHTGPVVAGIVGVKKFAYDIWGDTVNIASRMESSGEPGKTNISGTTYELVKDKFNCTYRGKIEAKNKGIIDMFFVESIS